MTFEDIGNGLMKCNNLYEYYIDDLCVIFTINDKYDTFDVLVGTNRYVFRCSKFILNNHHTNNIIQDISKQIIERIVCNKLTDENHILEAFLKNPEKYGLTKDYINEMDKKGLFIFQWNIMPWLQNDYNLILNQLCKLGYCVKRLDNYLLEPVRDKIEENRVCTSWYEFNINNKKIYIPAKYPQNFQINNGKFNNYENIPFWSLKKVLEEFRNQCSYFDDYKDDLHEIIIEEKSLN